MDIAGGWRICRAPTAPTSEPRAQHYPPMRCPPVNVESWPRTTTSTSAPGRASSSAGPPPRSKPDRPEDTTRHTAGVVPVSYTHLRAHETVLDLVCRLLLEKKNKTKTKT